jgi:hypothetical protein
MIVGFQELRNRLLSAFPPQPFHGLVSTHDECDEGITLRRELPSKRWDEISAQFVDDNSLSLPLLEPNALVAFLPAWLLRSMESIDRDSLVLEFTVYFLTPGNPDEGWDEERIAERVKLFDAAQRRVVGDFLRSIVECNALRYCHAYAEHGLKWWCA